MKNRILLDNYYLPGQLELSIGEFVAYLQRGPISRESEQSHSGRRLLRQRPSHSEA